MPKTGIHVLLDMLAAAEVEYVFGNPGTTELPLNDALVDRTDIRYIQALQEVPATAMADGYAMASGLPGVVNLHICCGLGNAMGMLYNAYRENTPLILIAGQQDRRLLFGEPILAGDMVSTTRPWTKWSCEINRVEDLPSAMRRAVQTAMTPPTGPVFLSLPLDVQTEVMPESVNCRMSSLPDVHVRPPTESIKKAAEVLSDAKRPAIFVGNRICESDAIDELVAVADQLGAPVIHEAFTTHGRISFPTDHPLFATPLPMFANQVRERLEEGEFDTILVAGMKFFQFYIHAAPNHPLPDGIKVVHLDDDPWELNKNYPVDVGVIGHPKESLTELDAALILRMGTVQREAAAKRREEWIDKIAIERNSLRQKAISESETRPMHPLALMEAIASVLPENVAVVEEAPTTTAHYLERVGALKNPSGYFAHRGWALGWGLNCAIGVQLAWPERPTLGIIGEGSAMYGIQGLWTAARYQIPTTFLIPNNAEYRILKKCAKLINLPEACKDRFVGLDLDRPKIDFVSLARSLGVDAIQVTEPGDVAEALKTSLSSDLPSLIEVPIS